MNYTMSYRHLDTANVASAGIIDFCPSLNLTLTSARANQAVQLADDMPGARN